jgi:hypothetical protein
MNLSTNQLVVLWVVGKQACGRWGRAGDIHIDSVLLAQV